MDDIDYAIATGVYPSDFSSGSNSQPVASTGKNDSTSLWGQLGSGLLTSTGSVLTTALTQQTAKLNASQTAKLAAANAANSSSTLKIILLVVAGLAVVGIIFAFLKRK